MKRCLTFIVVVAIIQGTIPALGSLTDALIIHESSTLYTLKINVTIENICDSSDSSVVGKDSKTVTLLSLPDCDYFCVNLFSDEQNDFSDEKYLSCRYFEKEINIKSMYSDEDIKRTEHAMNIKLSDSSKDAFLPDNTNMTEVVPEPGAVLLSAIGVGIVGWLRRRKTF